MFKNQSLFIVLEKEDGPGQQIARVEMPRATQRQVGRLFAEAEECLLAGRELVEFSGSYKPDADELLFISGFALDPAVAEAIQNPLSVPAFTPDPKQPPVIKALFMGEMRGSGASGHKSTGTDKGKSTDMNTGKGLNKDSGTSKGSDTKDFTGTSHPVVTDKGFTGKSYPVVVFQRFRKEQYIARQGISLFHQQDSFVASEKFGFTIQENADCLYIGGELRFHSFYYARQIFDLSGYYREATDQDIEAFIQHEKVNIRQTEVFKTLSNDAWVRRKIALIRDSGFLDKHPAAKIRTKAKSFGLQVSITSNRLDFPDDKKELKLLLKFLDEEIYRGVFSEAVLETNSKRRFQRV
jgi:hypothetical protein